MPSLLLTLAALSLTPAYAVSIRVTVTAPGPVGLAPAYATFHDGSFDFFDPGAAASGDTSGYTHPNGMTIVGGGPFAPNGGTASAVFDVSNADNMFSVAAMILPSNDWFVGNGSATDVSSLLGGAPVGTLLSFDLSTIWDAGTELEDFAFSPGNPLVGITTPANPAGGSPQNGVVALVGGPDPFGAFANLQPGGFDTTAIDPDGSAIASISLEVVPEPSALLLFALGAASLLIRRRRG